MYKYILISLLMVSCSQSLKNEDKQIQQTVFDYYNSLKEQDFTKMKNTTTSDFLMFENGESFTNDKTVAFFKDFPKFTVDYKYDSIKIRTDNNSARMLFYKDAAFVMSDTMHFTVKTVESATFRKEDGNWKLEFLHTTERK